MLLVLLLALGLLLDSNSPGGGRLSYRFLNAANARL